ncbi:glycosyl hydrolase family 18 protein [Shewanella surugensis]|uniref:chitinase n=1 Tax=Shewanella surugensis TaxID=212020 RepID=A0ABT0LBY0_9GAMM|nr:glycosyl hydrolase family 18 protein [Shewanella surugensis]MCL1125209.1 glycosyl hydrolase family 18 protein [Shewanella surugensis]
MSINKAKLSLLSISLTSLLFSAANATSDLTQVKSHSDSSDLAQNSVLQATGLSNYKIDSSKYNLYSNSYHANEDLPKITAYLSNWTHYQQGFEPNLDELAKYDTILLSFFGLCGTEIGDPTVIGGVNGLKQSCTKYGLNKYQLSTTDSFADLEKNSFRDIEMPWADVKWLDPNPNGMLGVMQKLHEEKGTRIGISVFGWSLSNIASDAVKPEHRQVFLNSLIEFVQAYSFIGQLDIDWEYPGILGADNNVFDPENDARNYKEFIIELRQALNNIGRTDILIGIASGAPTDKIDAAKLHDLVTAGVDDIHLMTYDFFGQWDTTLNHHTNLYSADDTKWSADKAITYMIDTLNIPAKNIQIGYANYSRNAIATGQVYPSPLKGAFTKNASTAGTFEAASSAINDILANYVNIAPDTNLTGKNGFTLYTDKEANADFLYNDNNHLFVSFDTPRTVYAKSQYALNKGLGGVFNWMGDPDEGLMLNAAREGLDYEVNQQVFDMKNIINSCGVNITSTKECTDLTYIADQGPSLHLSDQQAVFVMNNSYDLTAKLIGADPSQIKSIQWMLVNAKGVDGQLVHINENDKLNTSFNIDVSEEPSEHLVLTFNLSIALKDGSNLSSHLTYTVKVNESIPVITDISHDKQYLYTDIATGKVFSFSVNATDKADNDLSYQWDISSNYAQAVAGTENNKQLLIDTSSLINKPTYDVITQVTVTNKFGHTDAMLATTTVIGDADANNAPSASFSIVSDNLEQGNIIEIQSTSQDELVNELTTDWAVTFEDQPIVVDDSKGVIASFTPQQAGDYQVTLTVTDVFNVKDTVSETISVTKIDTNWDPETVYYTGDTVIYSGVTFTAKWYTKGDVPGRSDVWEEQDDGTSKEWSAYKVYNTGDTVIYNGETFTAKWYAKGDIPGESDVWASQDDGTTKEWSASKVYNTGDAVIYNEETFTAKWWTQGDLPSQSDVWESNK